jgi:cytochrome P450
MCFSKADVIQQTSLPQQASVIQQGNLLLEGSGRPAFASTPLRVLLDLRACPARGWPRQSQTKSPQQAQDLPLAPRLRRFAFEVIATVVLGLRGQNLEALFLDFEIWSRGLFALPLAIAGTAFAQALAARARLLQRLQGLLAEARQAAVRGEPWATAGLDLLAGGLDEAGLPLSEADLVEQLLLLLFAGYETTASTLNCLMLALPQQP